jgi:hypothetical protein
MPNVHGSREAMVGTEAELRAQGGAIRRRKEETGREGGGEARSKKRRGVARGLAAVGQGGSGVVGGGGDFGLLPLRVERWGAWGGRARGKLLSSGDGCIGSRGSSIGSRLGGNNCLLSAAAGSIRGAGRDNSRSCSIRSCSSSRGRSKLSTHACFGSSSSGGNRLFHEGHHVGREGTSLQVGRRKAGEGCPSAFGRVRGGGMEGGVAGGRRVDRDTVVVTIVVRLIAGILSAGGRERGGTITRQSS